MAHTGQLIIHEGSGLLELSNFLLRVNDQVEILLHDSWVSGTITLDQQGWYLLTGNGTAIRLQTGMTARLCKLSP